MSGTMHNRITLITAAIAAVFSSCAQPEDVADGIPEQHVAEQDEALQAPVVDSEKTPPEHKQWIEAMQRTPKPKAGCFTASYPDMSWHEVSCNDGNGKPRLDPRKSMLDGARSSGPNLEVVGGANVADISAQTNGSFTGVTGHFPRVSNLTSETDGTSGSYSLQLNTNYFPTNACQNHSGCSGWVQFLFENDPTNCSDSGPYDLTPHHRFVVLQYWLVGYGSSCPSSFPDHYGSSCAKSVYVKQAIPCQSIKNLTNMTVQAGIYQGLDNVNVSVYDPVERASVIWSATASDSIIGLAGHWTSAEFNVFANTPGATATFNSGVSIDVKMDLDDGIWASPTCVLASTTLEKNNLSLVPSSCCPTGGRPIGGITQQSLLFRQTFPASTVAPYCPLTAGEPIRSPLM
jgi:hypothetical protein